MNAMELARIAGVIASGMMDGWPNEFMHESGEIKRKVFRLVANDSVELAAMIMATATDKAGERSQGELPDPRPIVRP
jgi:hypothetical protein